MDPKISLHAVTKHVSTATVKPELASVIQKELAPVVEQRVDTIANYNMNPLWKGALAIFAAAAAGYLFYKLWKNYI